MKTEHCRCLKQIVWAALAPASNPDATANSSDYTYQAQQCEDLAASDGCEDISGAPRCLFTGCPGGLMTWQVSSSNTSAVYRFDGHSILVEPFPTS